MLRTGASFANDIEKYKSMQQLEFDWNRHLLSLNDHADWNSAWQFQTIYYCRAGLYLPYDCSGLVIEGRVEYECLFHLKITSIIFIHKYSF